MARDEAHVRVFQLEQIAGELVFLAHFAEPVGGEVQAFGALLGIFDIGDQRKPL